jgi:hypothetical protein
MERSSITESSNFLSKNTAFDAIVAQLTRPLKSRLSGLRYHQVSSGVGAAEFRYCPHGSPGLRRFVVIRRPVPEEPSAQLPLFQMGGYDYQVLVTNLSLTPQHLWRFYNQRARAELIIGELKYAYALGKIPTKDFQANEAFFQIVFAGLQSAELLQTPLRSSASATSEPATPAAEVIRGSFSIGATWRCAHIANRTALRSRSRFPRNSTTHPRLATPVPSEGRRTKDGTNRGSVPSSFDHFSRRIEVKWNSF